MYFYVIKIFSVVFENKYASYITIRNNDTSQHIYNDSPLATV